MTRTVTGSLRSVTQDLDALRSEITAGEPRPPSLTLRARIGFVLKRRLYRLMWWQTAQLRAAVDLMSRWTREEINALDAVAQTIPGAPPDTSQRERDFESRLQWLATTSSQRYRDVENRLQQLEATQQRLDASQQRLEATNTERSTREAEYVSLGRELSDVKAKVEQGILLEREQIDRISEAISGLMQRLDAEIVQRETLSRRLSEFGMYAHQTRTGLSVQERRLGLFLEEVRKGRPQTLTPDHISDIAQTERQHRYDPLYAAFEDAMRGSREEIKARQTVYVGYLQENGIGSTSMPVLDLGSGRGEWLQVLQEHNLQASGVDANDTMIERCQSLRLSVTKADALSYLGSLPDSSIGAVTSFHMIEHLPFDAIVSLIDQALRVLKRGGVIILETPNPANVLVGACTFHFDPTHLKPLPSQMLRFCVEARGFCDVHVRELHPYPEALLLPEDATGVTSRINQLFYGPQDYAVTGRKA